MDSLSLLHLSVLCAWAGLVMAELVVEVLGEKRAAPELVAELHFWLDVLIEVPLVLMVLGTGALLWARSGPLTDLHVIKIAAGLSAVGLNLYCAVCVVARYRQRHDPAALRRWGRHVRWSGLGVPFGAVAAFMGVRYFM